MNSSDLLTLYNAHPEVANLVQGLSNFANKKFNIKGTAGSMEAVVSACLSSKISRSFVFVMNDREEAVYFQNDLENMLGNKGKALLFPTSYKRPYQFEEVDNANILLRTEVLNEVSADKNEPSIIVTYPEALPEKVISKQTLVKNTFGVKVGDQLNVTFLQELLIEYGFTNTDFVYEPGNFSVRGGIIDIFSFSFDLPYRIELFGDEVESVRTFDPESQLSVDDKESISIIPDIQTKLVQETRYSVFDFFPETTVYWFKNVEAMLSISDQYYSKVFERFETIRENSGGTNVLTEPAQLFDSRDTVEDFLSRRTVVESGAVAFFESEFVHEFKVQSQPSFNKKFKLFVDDLNDRQVQGFTTIIASDSFHQLNRVKNIVEEHDSTLEVRELNIGLRGGFVDFDEKIVVYTDHQIFERYYKYKVKDRYSRSKALTLKDLKNLQPGDFVTHIDHGVGRFAGLIKQDHDGVAQEAIRLVFRDNDVVFVSVHNLHKISKYSGKEGEPPTLSKLGSPEWENKKKKVKKKVKEIAIDLIGVYAKRKKAIGFAFSKEHSMQTEMETSFIYEDTPDQAKATAEVKSDMEDDSPMDRLVCGDVGFGKTEVAIRAAFKAVLDGKQVAVLVPTTVLALQHYKTFVDRLSEFPVTIDYLNRFRSTKETNEVVKRLADGKIDIVVGTHKLVGKSIVFKDLGLLVIDEEQKFGVAVKDKLKEMKFNVDVLTLTATPIPRTLQFSLMGARDFSVISTPPPNRQPVTTEAHGFNQEVIRDAISYELNRGGQAFFVHNRIGDIDALASMIMKLVPDVKIGIAHGQMDGKQLEKEMMKFIAHEYDVLVSTNLIESGLDIPNANTIIINHAHMYGMSDLHQMRGRVGRSNKKAFCYLLTPSIAGLTSDARKRLKTLEEFSELGDGFKISMRDLDIRGAGNLLGGEQSGFVNDIGFDTYHKLLDETIKELKENEFKDLFKTEVDVSKLVVDCNIETDIEVIIPEDYVQNITERLRLYNEIDAISEQSKLDEFEKNLEDRFGDIPHSVKNLVETVKLRWQGERLGFEKLKLKSNVLKGYVTVEGNDKYFQSEVFGKILSAVQANSKKYSLREYKGKMIVSVKNVNSINDAVESLKAL